MINVTPSISLNESEIRFSFIRSPGPGGQNVNKVATAVLLRFDIKRSPSLTEEVRARLMVLAGHKVTLQGELLLKASRFRTQEHNKQDALERLQQLIIRAAAVPKKRKKTKPTFSSVQRRLTEKKSHAKNKSLRRDKPRSED